jgi:hypothetical protein
MRLAQTLQIGGTLKFRSGSHLVKSIFSRSTLGCKQFTSASVCVVVFLLVQFRRAGGIFTKRQRNSYNVD